MNVSKAVVRQLLGIDLCRSCRECCTLAYKDSGEEMPGPVKVALFRLEKLEEEALAHVPGGAQLMEVVARQEDTDDAVAYCEALADLQAALIAGYGERIDARNYLTLILGWLEDMRNGNPQHGIKPMPKHPAERYLCWLRITQLVAEIRDHYPEDEAHADAGAALWEKIARKVAA